MSTSSTTTEATQRDRKVVLDELSQARTDYTTAKGADKRKLTLRIKELEAELDALPAPKKRKITEESIMAVANTIPGDISDEDAISRLAEGLGYDMDDPVFRKACNHHSQGSRPLPKRFDQPSDWVNPAFKVNQIARAEGTKGLTVREMVEQRIADNAKREADRQAKAAEREAAKAAKEAEKAAARAAKEAEKETEKETVSSAS